MKTKPFNIDEAKAGAKVVTRDGRPAKIACYDSGGDKPILAYFEDRYGKHAEFYTKEGLVGKDCESFHDLFLLDADPELTKFEKTLGEVCGYAISQATVFPETKLSDFVKSFSPTLLSEAKKEFQKQLPTWKKCNAPGCENDTFVFHYSVKKNESYLYHKGYSISLDDLDKLPKEQ